MMFNPEELTRDTLAKLEAYSDPVRANWAERNYPTGARVLGVKAGDLHKVDREISKMLAGTAPEQVINFSQALVDLCVLECQQVAYGVLSRHKAAMPHIREKYLLSLGAQLDNWVSTDYFAGLVACPAWRERQVPDRLILAWVQSPDRWYRRTAVICTVALNQKARGGTGDPVRTLEICEYAAANQDDMVLKALSGALHELAKRDPAPVVKFINVYQDVFYPRLIREVERKITTGKKY